MPANCSTDSGFLLSAAFPRGQHSVSLRAPPPPSLSPRAAKPRGGTALARAELAVGDRTPGTPAAAAPGRGTAQLSLRGRPPPSLSPRPAKPPGDDCVRFAPAEVGLRDRAPGGG
jgi:hypothetical protein